MNLSRYIAALAISLLIFILGFWFGSLLANQEVEKLDTRIDDARLKMEEINLGLDLLLADPLIICNLSFEEISSTRETMGTTLTRLEEELGQTHPTVLAKKDEYYLIEAREYLLVKRIEQACGRTYPIIFYFYSNAGDCPACETQGYVIDDVRRNAGQQILTYSFELNSNSTVVRTLASQYGVHGAPATVTNGKTINGYAQKEQIERLL
ncbi:MAG: hypothetical protein ABH950_00565 [Candidatus Altiarchaeota archaeon]